MTTLEQAAPHGSGPRASKLVATIMIRSANVVLGTAASIVVARSLGPDGRGSYYVLVTAAIVATTIGHSSLDRSHLYLWSVGTDRRVLFANALVLSLTLGFIVGPAAFVLIVALGSNAVPVASYHLLAVALLAVPLSILTGYFLHLLMLADRIHWANAIVLTGSVVQCGALITLGISGHLTVAAVVYIWVLANIPAVFIIMVLVRPRLRDYSPQLAYRSLRLGLRYHLGTCAMYLLLRMDIFLLNAMVSKQDVGLYSLAVTLAELAYLVTDSVAHVMLPRQAVGSLDQSSQLTVQAVRLNVLAAVACVVGVALTAPLVIPLVYGQDFEGAVAPLLLIGPGIVALAVARPISVFLTRLNRPLAMSAISVSVLVLNVVLNLLLIPALGIRGAAIASTIAYAAFATVFVVWFLRASGLTAQQLVPRAADVRAPLSSLVRRRRARLT